MYSVDLQTSVWNIRPGKPNVVAIYIQAFGAHSLDPKSQTDLKFLHLCRQHVSTLYRNRICTQ